MKITKKQLYKIIKEELKEAYGFLGPDDDTEEDEWGPRAMQPDANDLDDRERSARVKRIQDEVLPLEDKIATVLNEFYGEPQLGQKHPWPVEVIEALDELIDMVEKNIF